MLKSILAILSVTTLIACSATKFSENVSGTLSKADTRVPQSQVGPDGIIKNCTPGEIPLGSIDRDSRDEDSDDDDDDDDDSKYVDSDDSDSRGSHSKGSASSNRGHSCSHRGESTPKPNECTDTNLNCICDQVELVSTPNPNTSPPL